MDRDNFVFHGERFAESVEGHYIRQEKVEKRKKKYKYWIFTIGILGIFYFLMTSIKTLPHNKYFLKDDGKSLINSSKLNFTKNYNCNKCFNQLGESNFLGRHSIYHINTKELCKWNDQNITVEAPEFPVSVIYKATNNIVVLESVFNLIYHPKHLYCIIIDDKSISDFIRKYIMRMSQCLPNIFVTNKQDNIRGHGLECLNILIHYKWNYTIILSENDIPIKSMNEIVKNLKLLNGTSDVPIYSIYSSNNLIYKQNTYGGIGIFKNKNILLQNNYIRDKELVVARTIVSITLSREDVNYYYNYINGENYIKFISLNLIIRKSNVFWPTLLTNKELNFPSHNIKLRSNSSINIGFLSFIKHNEN
uniref:C2H2-type domain-containing protein n=1 Tax=Strongyloides stercoralis TaxID=6248 RepID=A0AAF5D7B6_STRER